MICLRCGSCCKNLSVVIVKNPKKEIKKDNLIIHEGLGKSCPHLKKDKNGEYKCLIHDYKWYKSTPCYQYGQIERNPNTPCRVGEWVLKRGKPQEETSQKSKISTHLKEQLKTKYEELIKEIKKG